MKIEQKYKTNKNFGIYNSLLYIFKLRAFPKKFRKLTVSDLSLSKDMIKHIAASDYYYLSLSSFQTLQEAKRDFAKLCSKIIYQF